MGGSSIAAPGAAAWVTDFLNAAFYARPADDRDVADLRLALGILTTCWARRGGRRLGARDLPAFHRAFGSARRRAGGRLDRETLLDGAARLLGDGFAAAWSDDRRRAHGIAFATAAERDAFDPALRLRRAALGPLTPPERDAAERHWGTYPPVRLPDPHAALRFLRDPARWPDMGSAGGRFTAVRRGGLAGATFEIEISAELLRRAPLHTRAYVTCTALREDRDDLAAGVAALCAHADALPEGAEAIALVELTTHRGHFLGRAISHLLVFRDAAGAWIRDVGCWDPLPAHLAAVYATAGRDAQAAFWGPEPEELSMLAQLARVTGG
jgi:hypothetical protein